MSLRKRVFLAALSASGVAALLLALFWAGGRGAEEKPGSQTVAPLEPEPETAGTESVAHSSEEILTDTTPDETAYTPPSTEDPTLAAFVDRNAPGRVTADITTRIPRVRFKRDIPAVVSVLMDTEDSDTARNEASRLLRRSDYPELTDRLIEVLADPAEGPRFRSFCVQHLWENIKRAGQEEKARITSELHRALADRHMAVRREALLALVRTGDPKGEETAVGWLLAEDTGSVRDLAIRCVHKLGLREHIPTIRQYVRADGEAVRIAAIVTLSLWGDEESRPAIEEAAKSDSFRLRRCAVMALKRLDRAVKQARQDGGP